MYSEAIECSSLKLSLRSNWVVMVQIFYIFTHLWTIAKCVAEGGVLKFPAVIGDLSISPFNCFCFTYFEEI